MVLSTSGMIGVFWSFLLFSVFGRRSVPRVELGIMIPCLVCDAHLACQIVMPIQCSYQCRWYNLRLRRSTAFLQSTKSVINAKNQLQGEFLGVFSLCALPCVHSIDSNKQNPVFNFTPQLAFKSTGTRPSISSAGIIACSTGNKRTCVK